MGIYGHAAYETNVFTLNVLKKLPSDITSYATISDEIPEIEIFEPKVKQLNENLNQKNDAKIKIKKKTEKMSSNLSGIFSLLEIFQLIFL